MHKPTITETISTDPDDLPGEFWRDLPGYLDLYLISNYGRIKSVVRKKHRILTKKFSDGEFRVRLYKRGHLKNHSCARLCASAFLRNPTGSEIIRYIDQNKSFHHLSNLEWVDNSAVKKNLLWPNNGARRKMSDIQIAEIRAKRRAGVSLGNLAKEYGVGKTSIDRVVKGK